MAIELGQPTTLIVTQEERTWRIECFCDDGTDYRLVAHREILGKDQNQQTVSRDEAPAVTRTLSQVVSDPDALQFLGLAKALCDKWAQEDAAASAAPTGV